MKPMVYKRVREVELLHMDNYRGFNYLVVSYGTHPCAYVEIPEGHPYYDMDYDKMPIICHEGLNYYGPIDHKPLGPAPIKGYYIGWSYDHLYDYMGRYSDTDDMKYTTAEVALDCIFVINQLAEVAKS